MKSFIKSVIILLAALCMLMLVACNEIIDDEDEDETRKPKKTTEVTTEEETEEESEETTEHICHFGDWVVISNSTYFTIGHMEKECNCGEKETEEIPRIVSDGLAFEVNSDKKSCTITGIGNCTDTIVSIPDEIDNYTVVAIADNAFEDCTHITGLAISDNVKSIGKRAFKGCSGITEITIPEGVNSMGSQAFYKCSGLDTIYWNADYIGDYYDTVSPLAEATAKNVVFGGTSVQPYILKNSTSVENVTLLGLVASVDNYAFANCVNLKSVNLQNILRIEDSAFSGCTSLTDITMSKNLTKIGAYAFKGCTALKSIDLPDTLTKVESNAFENCSSMESFVIPSGMEVIPYKMFGSCYALKTVTIPDTVVEIEGYAFNGCKNLEGVVIPDSVTIIGHSAFGDCKNPIYCEATEKPAGWAYDWNSNVSNEAPVAWGGNHYCVDNDKDHYCDMQCGKVFYSEGLQYSVHSNKTSCTIIGIGTCKDEDLFIPESINGYAVAMIADYAFLNCNSIKSVTIPDTVRTIGANAFESCYYLKTVTLSKNVGSIKSKAFIDCEKLTQIIFKGTEQEWKNINKGSGWDSSTGNYEVVFKEN